MIEGSTEADPAALLGHTLVFNGNAAGRALYHSIDGSNHHLNLCSAAP
jgi:hypothetical protein